MNNLQEIAQQVMSGQMQNNPMMQMFMQMMQGKSPQQQVQTLLNAAQSQGFNINEKRFSEADLRSLGISPVNAVNSPKG